MRKRIKSLINIILLSYIIAVVLRLSHRQSRRNLKEASGDHRTRILYTVTSLHEFDDGKRATTKGFDRFTHILLNVVGESANSMHKAGFSVDVCLITDYKMSKGRRDELKNVLPVSSRLFVWDDATPLGYQGKRRIGFVTRALARQHRYVIKDQILNYEFFVNFEDDMLIKGEHVQEYLRVSNELRRLIDLAPATVGPTLNSTQMRFSYDGPMTKAQLARMIPGFIRVEVVEDEWRTQSKDDFSMVPADFEWNGTVTSLDPVICCHPQQFVSKTVNSARPKIDQLYFWETSLDALGVRKLPEPSIFEWVLLQAGNDESIYSTPGSVIGDYWTGCDYKFDNQWKRDYMWTTERPPRTPGQYINNMGGWMATRLQISTWHSSFCMGGFLPPYDIPRFQGDGLTKETVEFWSGGIHIFAPRGCNQQRVIPLDPYSFSRHLLYHSSNNKHKSPLVQPYFSPDSINTFWGRLITVSRNALDSLENEGGCKNIAL